MKLSNSNIFKIAIFIIIWMVSSICIAQEMECSEKDFLAKTFPCATGEGYIQEGCKDCEFKGTVFSCHCNGSLVDIDINSKQCKETSLQKVDLTYYRGALVCLRSPR